MEGQVERTGFRKIMMLILLIQGLILVSMAIPFRFIEAYRIATQGISIDTFGPGLFTLFSILLVQWDPFKKETRLWLLLVIFYDIVWSIWVFFEEFTLIVTDIRILLSILFLLPIAPVLYYIMTVNFTELGDGWNSRHEIYIEEILAYPTVEEGFDSILSLMENELKEKLLPYYKEIFLEFLSKRDDELGQLARDKM